jgi:hypothetical protein
MSNGLLVLFAPTTPRGRPVKMFGRYKTETGIRQLFS